MFKEADPRALRASNSRSTRGSSWTWRSGRSSTPGTPTGPGCTGAASGSRRTWAPRSTSAPWCSATSARPAAPASLSPGTRPPGKAGAYGDYLANAQGEDVVAGIRNTLILDDLADLDPKSHQQLTQVMRRLETHYRDLCDIEFTIERGKLWMLQTRVGKRTAGRGLPDRRATGRRAADHPGRGAGPGVRRAAGAADVPAVRPARRPHAADHAAWPPPRAPRSAGSSSTRATAKAWAARGEQVLLVRRETNPDDLGGMIAANGILTARGGKTSHAAVVARGMGKTCVCGAEELDIDVAAATGPGRPATVIDEGDQISIDGSTGEVFAGAMPVVPSPVETYIEHGLDAALADADEETAALVAGGRPAADPRRPAPPAGRAGQRRHRRGRRPGPIARRPGHRPVPDRAHVPRRPPDADRTGHPGRPTPTSGTPRWRRCCRCSGTTSSSCCEAMDGLPVTIRLLDPPLHEFLPDRTELSVKVAARRGNAATPADPEDDTGCSPRWNGCTSRTRCSGCAASGSACSSRACSRCRCGRSPRPRATSSRRGQRPAGRDHGAAGRVGDGAAPRPGRGRGAHPGEVTAAGTASTLDACRSAP